MFKKKAKTSQISTLTFIGVTCALVCSIRNIPNVAAAGYTMFLYMIIAALFYALPISLISGELSGIYAGQEGGMETWVTNCLGKKWGFVTSWLLWVQMFPGMVMVAGALSPLIGIIFGNPKLGENKYFSFAVILILYWTITILNLKFDMTKIGGKIGVWIGLYVPFAIFTIVGIVATIKTGIKTDSILGNFTADKFFGVGNSIKNSEYLVALMFIFTGIEMSSVHSSRLKKPVKDYIIGVIVALILMFILNVLNGFMVANAVPSQVGGGTLQNNNIAQGLGYFTNALGMKTNNAIVIIFCILVVVGVLIQLSAWAAGPSKTIISSARRGLYDPKIKFWKVNKHGVSTNVLITQAIVISIFAFVYLIIPGVQSAFLVLVFATAIIYSLAYVLMAISLVKSRIKDKNIKRPFKLGKTWFAITVVCILFISIIVSTILTVVYLNGSWVAKVAVVLIPAVLFVVPLIIYKFRKKDWNDKVTELLKTTPGQDNER